MRSWHRSLFAWLVALLPFPVNGQAVAPEVVLGLTVPTGDLGSQRSVGPRLGAGLLFRGADHRARFRVSLEATRLAGDNPNEGVNTAGSNLSIATLGLGVVLGRRSAGVIPYAVLGLAGHAMRAHTTFNAVGAFAAVGVRGVVRGLEVRGEVGRHAVLSDFATGQQWSLGSFVPVVGRVAF